MNTDVFRINDIDMTCEIRGAGEPLVLLHGFGGRGDDWRHVFDLDELATRYRVIVPDARGHGGSTNPGGRFTHRQCALDTAALLDQLGVARFRAIGMSMGGNILLHLATRERERVSSMVLVSATMYYPAPARTIMRQTPGAEFLADDYDDMSFTPPHLATIAARTMIVYGDRDPLYPVEMAVEMYRAIPGAALWVVPEGCHGPIFTGDDKVEFARRSLAFLSASS